MAGEYVLKNGLDAIHRDIKLKTHLDILSSLHKAMLIDDKTYRDELKKVDELLGFRTDQKFWTRDLF